MFEPCFCAIRGKFGNSDGAVAERHTCSIAAVMPTSALKRTLQARLSIKNFMQAPKFHQPYLGYGMLCRSSMLVRASTLLLHIEYRV